MSFKTKTEQKCSEIDIENEPTSVLRMIKEYQAVKKDLGFTSDSSKFLSGNRKSTFGSYSPSPGTSGSSRRWRSNSGEPSAKASRVDDDDDPLENISVLNDPNAIDRSIVKIEKFEELKKELNKLKMNIAERDAEIISCKTANDKWESHVKSLQRELKLKYIEVEQEKDKLQIDRQRYIDEIEDLQNKIKIIHKKERYQLDCSIEEKRDINKEKSELENEAVKLRQENLEIKQQLDKVNDDFSSFKSTTNQRESDYEHEIKRIQNELNEKQELQSIENKSDHDVNELKKQLEDTKLQLNEALKEVEIKQNELNKNQDVILERSVMKSKLERFPDLEKENKSLKEENSLLIQTNENIELLKIQLSDALSLVDKLQKDCEKGKKAEYDLHYANQQIQSWENTCKSMLMTDEEKKSFQSGVSPDFISNFLTRVQKTEIETKNDNLDLQSRLDSEERKSTEKTALLTSLQAKATKLETTTTDQAALIKRFQRKLILVAKERDSYKNVLESYEKELTITGGQLENDRLASMEKIVQTHKEMIENLENQLKNQKPSSTSDDYSNTGSKEDNASAQKIEELNKALIELQKTKDDLELELERRALRGDFNPSDTKVLHFKNNPTAEMINKRENQLNDLRAENESLKARVKLLEEGHNKDLTMLVGQKMEEGVSSKEVQDLKDQIQSAEVRQKRIIEAFKESATSFREAIHQLMGFRFDAMDDDKFRLTPVYALEPDSHIIFKKDSDGEYHLLSTDFVQSDENEEYLDRLRERHITIPVFIANILISQYEKKVDIEAPNPIFGQESTSEEEDNEDFDQDNEEEEENDDDEDNEEEAADQEMSGGDSDDPICLD